MQRKKGLGAPVFAAGIIIVLAMGLSLSVRWDLPLAQKLYSLWQQSGNAYANGDNALWYLWAGYAKALGGLPGWGGIAFLGFGLSAGYAQLLPCCKPKIKRVLIYVGLSLLLIGCVILSVAFFSSLSSVGLLPAKSFWSRAIGQVLFGVLCGGVLIAVAMFGHYADCLRKRLLTAAIVYGLFDLGYTVFSNLMKLIWQRTRFDTMAASEDYTLFTNWFHLPGNGGSSFPSGHTASAGVLLALVLICRLFSPTREDEKGFLFLGYAFAAFVGFGRMLAGRHYLSDVLAGITLDSILLAVAWYLPCLQRYLDAALQTAEAADPLPAAASLYSSFFADRNKKVFRAQKPIPGPSPMQSEEAPETAPEDTPIADENDITPLQNGKENKQL